MLGLSVKVLRHHDARSHAAQERILLGKRRIQSVLDREIVASRRTLEQKISDQGPSTQRVDPHLVGLAIMDLEETNRLQSRKAGGILWYANPGTTEIQFNAKLEKLLSIYLATHGGGFGNLVGDALELIVYKALSEQYAQQPRFPFLGHFDLQAPKNAEGRYRASSHQNQSPVTPLSRKPISSCLAILPARCVSNAKIIENGFTQEAKFSKS